MPSRDDYEDDKEYTRCARLALKLQDVVDNEIMPYVLVDNHYYAYGDHTTHVESLHHARLPFLGYKYKYYQWIAWRVNQANLFWNEGLEIVIQLFEETRVGASTFAKQDILKIAARSEAMRKYNLTWNRRIAKATRIKVVRQRMQSSKQARDADAYVGGGGGGGEANAVQPPAKKMRSIENTCGFISPKTNRPCLQSKYNPKTRAKIESKKWWELDGTLTLGPFCTKHMEQACVAGQYEGWNK
jgi:hypothetical protein